MPMKYKWILILGWILLFVGNAQANDCKLVQGKNFEGTVSIFETSNNINKTMPKEAFTQALNNLKAYCCSQNKITCTSEEKAQLPKEKRYPASIYLFDHLVDISMRRLDGIEQLAYGLVVDPVGKARREYITQAANNINGTQAKEIQEMYENYRSIDTKKINKLSEVKNNYATEKLSLAEKYTMLCMVMKDIYENVQSNPIIIGWYEDNEGNFRTCKNMVNTRMNREKSYVKMIMSKQSAQLLKETTKAYTKSYFIEEKLMSLWNLISKVKDMFQTIVQQAAVSKTCSQ